MSTGENSFINSEPTINTNNNLILKTWYHHLKVIVKKLKISDNLFSSYQINILDKNNLQ